MPTDAGAPSKRHWVQHDIERELFEFDDFGPDAGASFPPSIRIKIRVARGSNSDMCRMAFHDAVEDALHSSRMVLSGDDHNGSQLMLVAP